MENENKNEQLEAIDKIVNKRKEKKDTIDNMINFVDLDNIKFNKNTTVESQTRSISSILSSKPSYQVVCSQSGYAAKLSALVYRDIINITNSYQTQYETRREIFKTLYNKITGYSAQDWRPTFDEWLKATSVGDLETLFYGVYCSTFQDKSAIRYRCPICGEYNDILVENKKLVRVEDKKEMTDITKRINSEANTYEKIKELSLVTNTKQNVKSLMLPDSKIIYTIKMPSLFKILEILRTVEDLDARTEDEANIIFSTESVAIPDSETGEYSFIEHTSDIIELTSLLSVNDITVLKEVVLKLFSDKHITYCVENEKCQNSKCKVEIGQIPLDIEELLFFQITERRLS